MNPQILVVDLGSQYTLVIGRTLRELGFRSAILPSQRAASWLKMSKPKGIILSGGSASVYQKNAPSPPESVLQLNIPILGICYGMQWLAYKLGGNVVSPRQKKEYGRAIVNFSPADRLFRGMTGKSVVWASHGDSVVALPPNFKPIAWTEEGQVIAGMSDPARKIWGVQFHPEVTQTEQGKNILQGFLADICGCEKDWQPEDIITGIGDEVSRIVGNKRAVIGFSGGVDSSTLSAIVVPVLGKNLFAVCIDTGALRLNELEEIRENARAIGIHLKIIEASGYFQQALGNIIQAEVKRRRFKKLYKRILEKAITVFRADFVFQGTLATDTIESGGVGSAAVIKSHHNIGHQWSVDVLEPFSGLFKYEVRELSREMGLPPSITERQPFPGPGLFVRVLGKPPTAARLKIVKWADAEVTRILKKCGVYNDVSQLVVALDCTPSVGIKGDGRIYANSIIVRGVKTRDFMTAIGYQLPDKVRGEITSVVTKHPGIVRVFYDETNKPPDTIELE